MLKRTVFPLSGAVGQNAVREALLVNLIDPAIGGVLIDGARGTGKSTLARAVAPLLPYCLSFAAGAMLYVVVEELVPTMSEGEHSNVGTLLFAAGFTVMMMLDVALG